MSQPVHVHRREPDETVLPEEPEAAAALAAALEAPQEQRRASIRQVVSRHPAHLAAWAALGDVTDDPVEAYACYRVGYHRGLDQLRKAGWRGSGAVRSAHPTNRGFLDALAGLGRTAAVIGEDDEAARCAEFLAQLDRRGATDEGDGSNR